MASGLTARRLTAGRRTGRRLATRRLATRCRTTRRRTACRRTTRRRTARCHACHARGCTFAWTASGGRIRSGFRTGVCAHVGVRLRTRVHAGGTRVRCRGMSRCGGAGVDVRTADAGGSGIAAGPWRAHRTRLLARCRGPMMLRAANDLGIGGRDGEAEDERREGSECIVHRLLLRLLFSDTNTSTLGKVAPW